MRRHLLSTVLALLALTSTSAASSVIYSALGRPTTVQTDTGVLIHASGWVFTCETGQQPQTGALFYIDGNGQWTPVAHGSILWRQYRPDVRDAGKASCPNLGPYVGVGLTFPTYPGALWLVVVWDDGEFGSQVYYLPLW